jgi:pimeloyl-ACP methyl ester carboxylesterase
VRRPITPLLAAALLAGCGGDAAGPAATPQPAADGLHSVNGHKMFLQCKGRGSPVVVLDSGLGVPSATAWAGVMEQVSTFARVCRYDRPGLGLSEPATTPRTAARMVGELRALLRAARVPAPYVLAGASFGGLDAQLFARQAPGEVRGLVLVDSIHPDLDRRIEPLLGRAGALARRRALADNAEGVTWRDLLASDREVRAAPALPHLPLIALRHGVSFDPGGRPDPAVERLWSTLQRDLARQAGDGRSSACRAPTTGSPRSGPTSWPRRSERSSGRLPSPRRRTARPGARTRARHPG